MLNFTIACSLWFNQLVWVILFGAAIYEGKYDVIPATILASYGSFFAAIDYSKRVWREIRED